MTIEEQLRRQILADRILHGGMSIFDRWYQSKSAKLRKIALREKTKALCNYDRGINGEVGRMK